MNTAFIPQALCDQASRTIVHVFTDESNFNAVWRGRFTTEDAPGIKVHPCSIRVGDIIDLYQTGWNREPVDSIEFHPFNPNDKSGLIKEGTMTFVKKSGSTSVRFSGRNVLSLPVYVFNK
jgi:hypothetical protein